MHTHTICFIAALLLALSSCGRKEARGALYYPVDSLLTSQVVYLTNAKASLTKTVEVNGHDAVTIVPDSLGWRSELNAFEELENINKPVNQKLYTVNDGLKDDRSNLTIMSITTRDSLPIASMRIYYQDVPEKVRKIEAEINQGSALYASTRLLRLEFEDVNRQAVLSSYSLTGGQKIFLGDSVAYRINASISLPN